MYFLDGSGTIGTQESFPVTKKVMFGHTYLTKSAQE